MSSNPLILEECRVVGKKDFTPEEFTFLTLKQIKYKDSAGTEHQWESVERPRNCEGADGVAIFAVLSDGNTIVEKASFPKLAYGQEILLVAQFRPPVGKIVLEFPSGLIEPGESTAVAALRELREETGYSGEIFKISPIFYGEPGMSNSSCHLAFVSVDIKNPENLDPEPNLDDGELLRHVRVPFCEHFLDALVRLAETNGWVLDAKLYTLAAGLELRSDLSANSDESSKGGDKAIAEERKKGDKEETKKDVEEKETKKKGKSKDWNSKEEKEKQQEEEEVLELTGHVKGKNAKTKGKNGFNIDGSKARARTPKFSFLPFTEREGDRGKYDDEEEEEEEEEEDDGEEEEMVEVGAEDMMELMAAMMAGGGAEMDFSGAAALDDIFGFNPLAGMEGMGGMGGAGTRKGLEEEDEGDEGDLMSMLLKMAQTFQGEAGPSDEDDESDEWDSDDERESEEGGVAGKGGDAEGAKLSKALVVGEKEGSKGSSASANQHPARFPVPSSSAAARKVKSRRRKGRESWMTKALNDPLTIACGGVLVGCVTLACLLQIRNWHRSS